MMFNPDKVVWRGMRLMLVALMGISFACNRSGKSGDVALDRYRQLGHRIDLVSESISRTISAPRVPLSMDHLEAKGNAPHVMEDDAIEFRVEGVVMNERTPLVITSHGVAGLGEEVDGFKVVDIQSDAVTFMDRKGHSTKVGLYKEESAP